MELNQNAKTYIDSARELLDFLEANPELANAASFWGTTQYVIMRGDKTEFAQMALRLGNSEKAVTDTFFNVERKFGVHKIQVTQRREDICEKVVLRTEEVEVEEQDEDAVAEAIKDIPVVTKTVTREIVEWVCPPSLNELARQGA